jgi:hypothetical protein
MYEKSLVSIADPEVKIGSQLVMRAFCLKPPACGPWGFCSLYPYGAVWVPAGEVSKPAEKHG